MKNFFSKVWGAVKSVFTSSSLVKVVAIFKTVSPVIVSVVAAAGDEADAAKISAITAEINTDIGLIETLVASVNSSNESDVKSKVAALVVSINANFSALLDAAHIKDSVTKEKLETAISIVSASVSAVASFI